jgi:hypothetical protein
MSNGKFFLNQQGKRTVGDMVSQLSKTSHAVFLKRNDNRSTYGG